MSPKATRALKGYDPLRDGAAAEEAGVDAGEPVAGTTEEAGVVVVAGESAAVEGDAVDFSASEARSSGSGLWREAEELAGRVADVGLAPPPLGRLDTGLKPESLGVELVVVGFDGGASPAPDSTPVVSGLEGSW